MNLYKSDLYMSDLDLIIEHTDVLKDMKGTSVLIVGARGMVCSAIADLLFRYNEKENAGIHIYLAGRDDKALLERFSKYAESEYCTAVKFDSSKKGSLIDKLPDNISYIIDGIGPSAPSDIGAHPIDSLYYNMGLLRELLEYADANKTISTLYISSSEVYGISEKGGPFKEDDYGYIDILNPRSSYSCGKRSCETLCACYAFDRKIKIVIARPGHVYGPTARPGDDHIAAQFAIDAAHGRELKMKSQGLQRRSYCYMLDCASAILTILLRGNSADAYNISNPESVLTLRSMMSYIASAGGVRLSIADNDISQDSSEALALDNTMHGSSLNAGKVSDNPMPDSSLNSDKLLSLGWRGLFDARQGADHTIRIIRQAGD